MAHIIYTFTAIIDYNINICFLVGFESYCNNYLINDNFILRNDSLLLVIVSLLVFSLILYHCLSSAEIIYYKSFIASF